MKSKPTSPATREATLVSAFQDVTDGVITLMVQHLRLFSVELKNDGAIVAQYVGVYVFLITISILGYAFLNIAAVLFAGWAFGMAGMAITMLILAIGNFGISIGTMVKAGSKLSSQGLGPRLFNEEIKRSQTWAKQMQKEAPDSSQP